MNKNFIIQNGKAYIEKNGKAYEIEFNEKLAFRITNNELKDITSKNRYFLKEVLAKLNVKKNLAEQKKEVVIDEQPKVNEQPKIDESPNKDIKNDNNKDIIDEQPNNEKNDELDNVQNNGLNKEQNTIIKNK